jgi:hypothetical protein
MDFGKPYRTIAQANIGHTFTLSPTTMSEARPQLMQFSD